MVYLLCSQVYGYPLLLIFNLIPHLFVNAFLILFFRKKGNRLEADSLL